MKISNIKIKKKKLILRFLDENLIYNLLIVNLTRYLWFKERNNLSLMILLFNFLLSNLWKEQVWNINYILIILEINCTFTKPHCSVYFSYFQKRK